MRLTAKLAIAAAASVLCSGAAAPPGNVYRFIAEPLVAPTSPSEIAARCDAALALAAILQKQLETETGAATMARSFRRYDDLQSLLNDVDSEQYLVSETNPSKEIRIAAEACVGRLDNYSSSLQLSRPIYDRLSTIRKAGLDPRAAHVLARVLLQFRLAGVDRDVAIRAQLDAVQKRINAASLKFDGNIRDLKGETVFASVDDLAGMPADYLAAHQPGADGKIRITTDYPDSLPILSFADRETTRRAVLLTFNRHAWPENGPVLIELLTAREQLAHLLGFANFAALAMVDKMIATPEHAATFLERINEAALPGSTRDYAELLARWRRIDPKATAVDRWNSSYVAQLLRKEQYGVDDAVVRRYFTYAKSQRGIFQLAHDLFGADIRPWKTNVWAPGVTAWELYDGRRLVGRFYLDPFPRPGKYSHLAEFPIRIGVEGKALPLAALVMNLPATGAMDHSDVQGFLHEFGHLLHALYSGHQAWGVSDMHGVESDFLEAPSQLLEEWVWDYPTLAHFASDAQGRPIPADLVARMNRARVFEQGITARGDLMLAAVSLAYHLKPAAQVDLDREYQEQVVRYSPFPPVLDTHVWARFSQLSGYGPTYYTYAWSKALALDLFTRFQRAGMRDRATALAYRRLVLEPGGSASADQLIHDFLGREPTLDAYRARLLSK